MEAKIGRIAFIGAGNVAWHLAKAFIDNGVSVGGVWNRTPSKAQDFANDFSVIAYENLDDLQSDCDLILIAVSDSAISEIITKLIHFRGIVAHTAGSVPLQILDTLSCEKGVVYPLQTLTHHNLVDISSIPILIESDTPAALIQLTRIAEKISNHVLVVNSSERLIIHTAAVFVNNFTNLMYVIGDDILKKNSINPSLLGPLIKETARKALQGNPIELQTGPARRHDIQTMEKHLKVLEKLKDYSEIYTLLSNEIEGKFDQNINSE